VGAGAKPRRARCEETNRLADGKPASLVPNTRDSRRSATSLLHHGMARNLDRTPPVDDVPLCACLWRHSQFCPGASPGSRRLLTNGNTANMRLETRAVAGNWRTPQTKSWNGHVACASWRNQTTNVPKRGSPPIACECVPKAEGVSAVIATPGSVRNEHDARFGHFRHFTQYPRCPSWPRSLMPLRQDETHNERLDFLLQPRRASENLAAVCPQHHRCADSLLNRPPCKLRQQPHRVEQTASGALSSSRS